MILLSVLYYPRSLSNVCLIVLRGAQVLPRCDYYSAFQGAPNYYRKITHDMQETLIHSPIYSIYTTLTFLAI